MPLPLTIISGAPRLTIKLYGLHTIPWPEIDVPTTTATYSRVPSSTKLSSRVRRGIRLKDDAENLNNATNALHGGDKFTAKLAKASVSLHAEDAAVTPVRLRCAGWPTFYETHSLSKSEASTWSTYSGRCIN